MQKFNSFRLHNIEVMSNDFVRYSSYKVALKAIEELGHNWRLPTIKELKYLYKIHKLGVGGFSNDSYWSSSNLGVTGCEIIRMSDGYVGVGNRNENLAMINTRLVRDL